MVYLKNQFVKLIGMNKDGNQSIVGDKSYSFALEIIKLYKELTITTKEYVLSKQILRSGTPIGANINEAVSSVSKRDFVHKLSIALKEARETNYWLNLLKDSNYIGIATYEHLSIRCKEIMKILSSIILTTKERYLKQNTNITTNP